ncbi:hypothetical protein UP86_12770, partial [Escherichia coli]
MIELVIVSRLLEYPDAALWQHQQEMFEAIAASKNLPKEDAHALGIFLRDLTTMDPLDAQAQYSELFDRGRGRGIRRAHVQTATVTWRGHGRTVRCTAPGHRADPSSLNRAGKCPAHGHPLLADFSTRQSPQTSLV